MYNESYHKGHFANLKDKRTSWRSCYLSWHLEEELKLLSKEQKKSIPVQKYIPFAYRLWPLKFMSLKKKKEDYVAGARKK